MGRGKNPIIIDINKMRIKNTKELLGYLKRLQQCEESLELSDREPGEVDLDGDIIYFKQSDKWKEAYTNVKSILGDREHVKK